MKVKFISDKVTIRGPRVDGSMIVSFEVGEYEKHNALKALLINEPVVVELRQYGDEEEKKLS